MTRPVGRGLEPAKGRLNVMGLLHLRTNQRLALLRSISLFSSCNKNELNRIASLMTMVNVERGTVLTQEDRTGRECFIIVEGAATASRRGLWLADFGAGSFFGELALLDNGQRTATVVASTDLCLLVISRIEFNSLEFAAPSIMHSMLVELGGRLRSTDELLDEESSSASSRRMVAVGAT